MDEFTKITKIDRIQSFLNGILIYGMIFTVAALIAALFTGCGVKVKHAGESHHYIHVDGETKHTADINADIDVVVALKIEQIVDLCNESDDSGGCITDSINQLLAAFNDLQETTDGLNDKAPSKGKSDKPKCNNDFCQ